MKKANKFMSLLIVACMVVCMVYLTPVSANAAEYNTEYYYFYMPEEWKLSNDLAIPFASWADSDQRNAYSTKRCLKTQYLNVFLIKVSSTVTRIVWANTYEQREFTRKTVKLNCDSYQAMENRLYPNGMESFNNMVFIVDTESAQPDEQGIMRENGKWYNLDSQSLKRLGDVDGDNALTVKDATIIQRYIVGSTEFDGDKAEIADYNYDSKITVNDVSEIQKHLITYQ